MLLKGEWKEVKQSDAPKNDVNYSKMSKQKLIASLQVARGEIDYLTKQSAEKSDLLGKLKAQYVTVSSAAEMEYEKFLETKKQFVSERDEWKEALKAKDARIKVLTLEMIISDRAIRIIKATVNGIKFVGEDTNVIGAPEVRLDD